MEVSLDFAVVAAGHCSVDYITPRRLYSRQRGLRGVERLVAFVCLSLPGVKEKRL